jgi:DNA modification methylase
MHPADLIPYARNAKKHDPEQVAKIAGSIREFGFNNPVLVDQSNGIIAGHGRVMAALKLGLESVPVIRLSHLSETQRRAYILADNKLAELGGGWDEEMLKVELEAIKESDLDHLLTGFSDEEMAELLAETNQLNRDPDEVPETPEDPITKPGDLWILGEHRLLCGDSTKAEDVDRLMAGTKADACITDPPYGVSYADKNRFLNAIWLANRIEEPIENDHDDVTTTAEKLWRPAFDLMNQSMKPGAAFYVFSPQGGDQMMMMMMMAEANIPVRHELIWVKNNHVLGRADYAYKHEPVLYGWKPGAAHQYHGGFQTSLLEFDRPQKSGLHPTTKPLELVAHLMKNNTVDSNLVLDLFLGSGTTLIAAEQLGRTCYGMEISPQYCDVIVKRWETLTGKKATRAADVL